MKKQLAYILPLFLSSTNLEAGSNFYCTRNLDPKGDNWVAVRSDPSTQTGYRIRKIGPNQYFDVFHWADHGRWAYVHLDDGTEGYVSARYVYKCAD